MKSELFEFVPHPIHKEIDVCKNTGLHRYNQASHRNYTEDYFLEEYNSQYNKTYYEDESNIRNLARSRLKLFSKALGWERKDWKPKRVLEIGTATGFFLDEAKYYSNYVQGVEISKDAADYGIKILNLDIRVGNFMDEAIVSSDSRYDAIFSFFTIEHISDIAGLWDKISKIINRDGGIMLGLPSFYGPTFHTNPREWFLSHPLDHFFDYSPMSLKKVLNHYSMVQLYNKPLSYHPLRDRGCRGLLPNYLFNKVADWQCYGDTFQIIAKKL